MPLVVEQRDGIGCRDAALASLVLLGFATGLFAIGLTFVNRDACDAWCATLGLTLLYAGGPVSALIGVFSDSVVIAWPLDLTLWVTIGFLAARRAGRREQSAVAVAMAIVAVALAFGLVLSQLVELAV